MANRRVLARDALGLALRVPHYTSVTRERPALDYFELLSDNYLRPSTPARGHASRVAELYPVVLHGVGLNLLGSEPLDEAYLDALSALADAFDVPFVSDHLCWSRHQAMTHHDLLPTPHTEAIAEYVAERAAYVQRRLARPLALENVSSYVAFRSSTMPEWDFYTRVVEAAGASYMLDVNNIYVSSENHGFDAKTYLEAIDFSRVVQVHLAGHQHNADGVIVDTHDRPVADAVWELYREAWKLGGPFPTLLEWDDAIPELSALLAELERAREART